MLAEYGAFAGVLFNEAAASRPHRGNPGRITLMTAQSDSDNKTTSRRRFVFGAGVTAAAAVAAPAVQAQSGPISMRWQSTWPSKDIFHEYACLLYTSPSPRD